jgi:hypothetical protein
MQKRPTETPSPGGRQIETEDDGSTRTITAKSLDIRTLEDLIQHSNVDMSVWSVDKHVCNSWEVTTGDGRCYTNYQVKAWFKPIVPEVELEALQAIVEGLTPRRPIKLKVDLGELLFVPTQFDSHFGKLAWAPETGADYDIKIAEERFDQATAFSAELAQRDGRIGRILLPVGSDLFHVNTQANETAKGTPQAVDGRLPKIFRSAYGAVIRQVERLAHIAPIDVVPVHGNHDPQMMMSLMEVLAAWFRNTSHVTVDTSLKKRVAYIWGDCFIGFDHGDGAANDKLPTTFSTEFPELWGSAKYRIIFIGHWHKKKEMRYVSCDTYGNAIVHVCPSLSGTDDWHYLKGFIGDKITENHVFTKFCKLSTFEVTASELERVYGDV